MIVDSVQLYHSIGWNMAQCDTIAEGRRIVAWDDWELSTWDGGEVCESNDQTSRKDDRILCKGYPESYQQGKDHGRKGNYRIPQMDA